MTPPDIKGGVISTLMHNLRPSRPTCSRCKGPLDFFFDPETNRYEWCCNNPIPIRTDEEFWQCWDNLPGDEIAKLTRECNIWG